MFACRWVCLCVFLCVRVPVRTHVYARMCVCGSVTVNLCVFHKQSFRVLCPFRKTLIHIDCKNRESVRDAQTYATIDPFTVVFLPFQSPTTMVAVHSAPSPTIQCPEYPPDEKKIDITPLSRPTSKHSAQNTRPMKRNPHHPIIPPNDQTVPRIPTR